MSRPNTRTICRIAVLAALYAVLTLVSIRAGNLRITFASLPVVICAALYGPWQAATVALLGEFLNQMLSYGFSATTVLWLIPPALRGILVGLAAVRAARVGRPLMERPALFYGACMGAALATTAANTLVIWADSVVYSYFTVAYVFGDAMLRFLTGIVTAAVVATVALPMTRLLRRYVPAAS